MVFYRRAREMHTDGLLGGCEYRRNLWVTNMSLSDATAAYRRAGLARDTADSATISTPVDGYKRTNRAANSMGMITIDGAVDCDLKDASVAHGDCQFWVHCDCERAAPSITYT
jgi:hypothetical protein